MFKNIWIKMASCKQTRKMLVSTEFSTAVKHEQINDFTSYNYFLN